MSGRSRLAFERIEIQRMPGIETGFAVDGLCPGINVICGPNASGKTTLTRAVATLLWPRSAGVSRAILHGNYALDGRAWRVEFDSGSLRCQADGQDADLPSIDAADGNDRYLLALHDLLRADNRNFAEAILRESTGGYDVGQAASELGFSARPAAPNGLRQRHEQALAREREARGAQDRLRQQERERDDLLVRQEQARAAGQRAQAIERALAVHRARTTMAEATRELAAFPAILARLSGSEPEELDRLRQRQLEAEQAAEQDQIAIAAARERQLATGLTTPLPPATIAGLRERFAALQDDSRELRIATERRTEAEAVVAVARQAIGPALSDDQLAALDPVQFNALAGLMQQSRDAHATLAGLDNIAAWIPPLPQGSDQDDERGRLAMGARCLTRWLRQGNEPADLDNRQSSPAPLLIAAGVAVIESVLLGVLAHPAFLVLLPVTVVLLVLGLRRRRAPERAADADWRAEYLQLGLPAPATWTPDAVEALIEDLLRRTRRIQADQEAHQRWQYVRDERPTAVRHAEAVDRQVAGWCARFGVPAVRDVAALHTLANAISSWQEARGRAASASALQATAQARVEAALAAINAVLMPFGYPAADGFAGISSAIDNLAARDRDRSEANAEEQRAERRLAGQLLSQQQRCRDDLHAFFNQLGLSDDDDLGLQMLLERLPDYRAAALAVERAGLALEHAQAALGDAALLAEQAPADLDIELRAAQAQHAELDDIVQQIAAINARIEQARQGSSLEAALAGVETAAGALRDARDTSEALVAGWTLAEFVRQQTRDIDRPRVFHRARELFARITQGRYVLDVDAADPPRFRARDTVTGTGHGLDELSSGTRLQLLLAVRVAFVEQQERGPMLPLILDETLGNSDEHRARAIIDATVQIAREGRQVLYLTAQHDEVRKWQAIMAERPEVPFALVDLAQVRGLADWERLPVAPPQDWPLPIVPAPNGHDRAAYGELLKVPGIDLTAADSGSIHLWHLIDEPSALHSLLSLQIETWGQLRTLAEHGGVNGPFAPPALIQRCRARARVIETLAEAVRIGRGKPVDRAALLESGAITPVFIDRVAQLATELDGDAIALLAALEAGQLRSFHTNARLRLQEYLEENGYIDLTPPLTPELIRARVLASGGQALADGLLTHEWINTTLAAAGTIFAEERSAR